MKILVTGAGGMLGQDVVRVFLEHGHEVHATDITSTDHRLDITKEEDIQSVLQAAGPDWVVNCAACTDVDACEDHEADALLLNARAPAGLARACREHSVRLLHVSTDYVFDGTRNTPYLEHDVPRPVNAYGRTKLEGEIAISGQMDDFIIVRSQWLFGLGGKNFVSTIIRAARNTPVLRVVNDQHGSPTYTRDLATAMRQLVELDARGIYHVCNRGTATWFDLAKKALELLDLDAEVVPVTTEEFPRPAKRPLHSVLSMKKFTDMTGKLMPIWPISLKEYLKEFLHEERSRQNEKSQE
jgi:dTDP-4-dehydrorhamnose reductase